MQPVGSGAKKHQEWNREFHMWVSASSVLANNLLWGFLLLRIPKEWHKEVGTSLVSVCGIAVCLEIKRGWIGSFIVLRDGTCHSHIFFISVCHSFLVKGSKSEGLWPPGQMSSSLAYISMLKCPAGRRRREINGVRKWLSVFVVSNGVLNTPHWEGGGVPSAHHHPSLHARSEQVADKCRVAYVPPSVAYPWASHFAFWILVSSLPEWEWIRWSLCFPSRRSLTGHGCWQTFSQDRRSQGKVFTQWRSPQEVTEPPPWQERAAPFW